MTEKKYSEDYIEPTEIVPYMEHSLVKTNSKIKSLATLASIRNEDFVDIVPGGTVWPILGCYDAYGNRVSCPSISWKVIGSNCCLILNSDGSIYANSLGPQSHSVSIYVTPYDSVTGVSGNTIHVLICPLIPCLQWIAATIITWGVGGNFPPLCGECYAASTVGLVATTFPLASTTECGIFYGAFSVNGNPITHDALNTDEVHIELIVAFQAHILLLHTTAWAECDYVGPKGNGTLYTQPQDINLNTFASVPNTPYTKLAVFIFKFPKPSGSPMDPGDYAISTFRFYTQPPSSPQVLNCQGTGFYKGGYSEYVRVYGTNTGAIDFISNPPGATVGINGSAINGPAPFSSFLGSGNYNVQMVLSGYKSTSTIVVNVRQGKRTVVTSNLQPNSSSSSSTIAASSINIQSGYITVNGNPNTSDTTSTVALREDNIQVMCIATFGTDSTGRMFKCRMTISTPSGNFVRATTALQQAYATTAFGLVLSDFGISAPYPTGLYGIADFIILDSNENMIVESGGRGSGNTEYLYIQEYPVTWRIGKNYNRTCSACPRTPIFCKNYLEESDTFAATDTIWAVYETQCSGNAPINYWFNWYRLNSSGAWYLVYQWQVTQQYPTAAESWIIPANLSNAPYGTYKVEYAGFSTQFNVTQSTLSTIALPSNLSIYVGQTLYPVVCKDISGNIIPSPPLSWSKSTDCCLNLYADGAIEAVNAGTETIRPYDPVTGIYANTCTVTITAVCQTNLSASITIQP